MEPLSRSDDDLIKANDRIFDSAERTTSTYVKCGFNLLTRFVQTYSLCSKIRY